MSKNVFHDDKVRAKNQIRNLIKREEAREITNQIDVHDLESTNDHIGANYMSNVETDVAGTRVFRLKNILSILVIIACVIFFIFILSTII